MDSTAFLMYCNCNMSASFHFAEKSGKTLRKALLSTLCDVVFFPVLSQNFDKTRGFSAFSFSGKSAILVDRKRYHRAVSLAKEQEYHNETENQKEIRPPAPAVRTHRLYGSVRQQPCDLSCHRRERDPAERLRAVLRCDAGGPAHRRTIQHRRLFVRSGTDHPLCQCAGAAGDSTVQPV